MGIVLDKIIYFSKSKSFLFAINKKYWIRGNASMHKWIKFGLPLIITVNYKIYFTEHKFIRHDLIIKIMGCGSNQKETDAPIRLQTVNGTLKITIANAKLQHVTSSVFSMDPYVNLKMSNQNATTTVKLKGGK